MLFSAIPSCVASRQCDAASDVRTCGTYDTTSLKSQECDFILQPTLRGVLYVYASTGDAVAIDVPMVPIQCFLKLVIGGCQAGNLFLCFHRGMSRPLFVAEARVPLKGGLPTRCQNLHNRVGEGVDCGLWKPTSGGLGVNFKPKGPALGVQRSVMDPKGQT